MAAALPQLARGLPDRPELTPDVSAGHHERAAPAASIPRQGAVVVTGASTEGSTGPGLWCCTLSVPQVLARWTTWPSQEPGSLEDPHLPSCPAPGLMEALIRREDETHGGTEEHRQLRGTVEVP